MLEDGSDTTEEELQAAVSDVLSFAKVPKRIVVVDEIPTGPTGKLQRMGLADRLGITTVRSTGSMEQIGASTLDAVGEIWQNVLELETVGPDRAFLESGGDSISAAALAVAIEEKFEVDLPLLAFYNAATIRSQAILIEELLSH